MTNLFSRNIFFCSKISQAPDLPELAHQFFSSHGSGWTALSKRWKNIPFIYRTDFMKILSVPLIEITILSTAKNFGHVFVVIWPQSLTVCVRSGTTGTWTPWSFGRLRVNSSVYFFWIFKFPSLVNSRYKITWSILYFVVSCEKCFCVEFERIQSFFILWDLKLRSLNKSSGSFCTQNWSKNTFKCWTLVFSGIWFTLEYAKIWWYKIVMGLVGG